MDFTQKTIENIKAMAEPPGWPGDIRNPIPLGRAIVSPVAWQQYATVEEVSLDELTSIQETVNREQVIELIRAGAPDIEPLPLVTKFPNGEYLVEDGNHRLAAKVFPKQQTAKVRLIDTNTLPEEAIYNAMDRGKISMKLFSQLIGTLVKEEIKHFLFEQIEPDWLCHVTHFNRLENISKNGLTPGAARSIGGSAYDTHAAKGIFLTDFGGVDFWYNKAEAFAEHNSDNVYEDGLVPVVLRIDYDGLQTDLETDEPGSTDSRQDAFIHRGPIGPEHIEVWTGSDWIPVEDYWGEVDIELTLDKEELEGDDGEPEEYYLFKYSNQNPLIPK